MSKFKSSPKSKKATISTVPDGEATPIVKGSHVYLVDGSGYIFRAYPRPAAADAQVRRPAGRRGARLLQHAVEAAGRHEGTRRADPSGGDLRCQPRRPSATSSTPTTRPTGRRRRKTWSRSSRWCARRPGPSACRPRAGRLRGRRPDRRLCLRWLRGRRRGGDRLLRQGPDAAGRRRVVDARPDEEQPHRARGR